MTTASLRRACGSTGAVLTVSAATLVGLVALRPQLAGSPTAWSGDDLAIATAWVVAVGCAAWLVLTALACLAAMLTGRRAAAARIAGWGPPLARRILQTTLVGTFAVIPAAAYAAPSSPLILHVGPGGRLTAVSGSPPASPAPVVRAPPAPTTTVAPSRVPTAPARPVTPPSTSSVPPLPTADVPRSARPATAPHEVSASARTYVVRTGDNLWRISRAEVARTTGIARPENSSVARYWLRVIDVNRATLRSGDPSLIYPGEIVTLPI